MPNRVVFVASTAFLARIGRFFNPLGCGALEVRKSIGGVRGLHFYVICSSWDDVGRRPLFVSVRLVCYGNTSDV